MTPRVATLADLPAIDALLARSYPVLLAPDYPPSVLATVVPIIARAQPELVTSGTYWVVRDGGAALAVGGWTRARPGRSGTAAGLGHVRHVAADPGRLRQGLARAVMTAALDQAREAGVTRAECLSTRTAVPFYAAMGFVAVREMEVPLGPARIGFPAVEMARAL